MTSSDKIFVICRRANGPTTAPLLSVDLDKALDTAQAVGWTVFDMKNDRKKIFPFGSK